MSGNEEIKQAVLEWFKGKKGEKHKFYLKDVTKAMRDIGYDKKDILKAVNECIEEDTLMWFSTGSTNMICLPEWHKG